MCELSFDGEAPVAARFLIVDRDIVHARATWSGTQCALDTRHRLGLAFDQRFDAAVRQIPYPSCDAFAAGGILGEPAEPDTLDPAADDESPCDAHREERPIISGKAGERGRRGGEDDLPPLASLSMRPGNAGPYRQVCAKNRC